MKINWTKLSNRASLVGLLSALAFTACAESNPDPNDPDVINPGGNSGDGDGDKPGDGDGDTPGDGDGDTPGDGDGDNNVGGGGSSGDGDGDGDTGTGGNLVSEPEREDCPAEPDDENNVVGECWDLSDCNGVATEQFLNQCAGEGTCIGFFDNEDKIEGFDGTLPPLN